MLGKIILSAVGVLKGDFSQLGGNLGYNNKDGLVPARLHYCTTI